MSVDPHVIRELEAIVGAEHVRTERGDVEPYARDATPLFRGVPDAVVWPRTAEEVAAILRLATAAAVPVVPRGAGSNLCAATVADRGGIVLVLTRMDQILEVSPDELLARVEAGVTTAALADAAAARRACCTRPTRAAGRSRRSAATSPPAPAGCAGSSTASPATTCWGPRPCCPTGEVIRTGGRLWKDVAGYDLTRLLTGSEGTLGVLTEVTVALLPMPATTNTGVAYFPSLSDAGRAVAAVIGAGIVPATLEFLDAKCIGAVEEYANLGLRLRRRGAAAVRRRRRRGRGRPQPGPHRRACARRTAAMEVTLAEDVARSEALLDRPALLAAGAVAAGHADDPGGRDGAAATAGRDGRPDRRDRRAARRADRHVRARRRRQPAPDLRGRPARRGRDRAGAQGVRRHLHGGDRDGRHDHRRARRRRGEAAVPDRPAGGGPDGPAAPDQDRVRPGRDPQPREAGLMTALPASRRPPDGDGPAPSRGIFDPELLDRCISCGFCLPACPTYALTQDEGSSPRGRITLMRALDTGRLDEDDPRLREESSFCLGCRACEPVCPAGVQYGAAAGDSGATTSGAAGTARRWRGC